MKHTIFFILLYKACPILQEEFKKKDFDVLILLRLS